MSLQRVLYKEILLKKQELENVRKNGGRVNDERDLPCMAVGCEEAGVERCGFSCHSKHVKRPDIRHPFDPMLELALLSQSRDIPKLPFVLFKKKKKRIVDVRTGEVRYKREVEKFIGTCAEDNAANCVLKDLNVNQRPLTLKQLTFVHPIRVRTLKRERMCVVCRNIFTEP